MSVVSIEKRLRRIEATRNDDARGMHGLSDDDLVDAFRQSGPLTADDEAFLAWFQTGMLQPLFDIAVYIAPVLR